MRSMRSHPVGLWFSNSLAQKFVLGKNLIQSPVCKTTWLKLGGKSRAPPPLPASSCTGSSGRPQGLLPHSWKSTAPRNRQQAQGPGKSCCRHSTGILLKSIKFHVSIFILNRHPVLPQHLCLCQSQACPTWFNTSSRAILCGYLIAFWSIQMNWPKGRKCNLLLSYPPQQAAWGKEGLLKGRSLSTLRF